MHYQRLSEHRKRITSRRVLQFMAVCLLLILLPATAKALLKFLYAVVHRMKEFELGISVDKDDCFVILWTRRNTNEYEVIRNLSSVEELTGTHFNRDWPVKILFHGFSDKSSTLWTNLVKNKYLLAGDYNVFSVDWEKLARSPWYSTAAKNADLVGEYSFGLIKLLTAPPFSVNASSVHVIGSSLGGQVAAHLGHHAGGRLGRITGLDPSGPLFHSAPPSKRLDKSDARFVDVIHSAGKWVGNDEVIGHADFFPNLGVAPQPGCDGKESVDLSCSHWMSWRLFAESIGNSTPFVALRCASAQDFASELCCQRPDPVIRVMGDAADPDGPQGKFYLYTNEKTPMAKDTPQESTSCQWIDFT